MANQKGRSFTLLRPCRRMESVSRWTANSWDAGLGVVPFGMSDFAFALARRRTG